MQGSLRSSTATHRKKRKSGLNVHISFLATISSNLQQVASRGQLDKIGLSLLLDTPSYNQG